MVKSLPLILILSAFFIVSCGLKPDIERRDGPFLATGIKIGEVTQHRAIIWTRLTQHRQRVGEEAPMPVVQYKDPKTGALVPRKGRPNTTPVVTFSEGSDIRNIEGAAPGSPGEVRLRYREAGQEPWQELTWETVDPQRDFTHQFALANLRAGTPYQLEVQASKGGDHQITATIQGKFVTAPEAHQPSDVNFIVTTGTSYPDVDTDQGYQLYPHALKLQPEFFVHTGDILYYDGMAKTEALARWHWDRMYSLPNHIEFHRQVPSYFIKDDHDTWMNDCYPGMQTKFMGDFTYDQGTQIFLDEVPMGKRTYRTVRWGKDLQIWLVEGRDYRSPNPMPDGPDKTIWGAEQMQWFKETVSTSDATFKILISPTPVVGPDRTNKNDNHANRGFKHEGDQLRKFIAEQGNMVVVCGDRHWQYISKDTSTGILEFSCGPGADEHAGGWKQEDKLPEHLYLNVVGGFMEGSVGRASGREAELTFRHYSPVGELLHEFVW